MVLPDTQVYTSSYPQIFKAQTDWIAANAAELDLKYVLHVGDVTCLNTAEEWTRARTDLDELKGIVPLAIVPGNHDYALGEARSSGLTDYFPVADIAAMPTFGGLYELDRSDNSYHLFGVDGATWMVLALEWGPRNSVLDWANQVLNENRVDHVILLTHAYLYSDATRYDWSAKGDSQQWNPHYYEGTRGRWPEVNDGQEIWEKVINSRSNVDFVISGHVADNGVARKASRTMAGSRVYELLSDYQGYAEGGEGYLRIIRFYADHIAVSTYSPYRDAYYTDLSNQFCLPWGD